jgi:Endonuclease NucS C-terminal domain
LGYHPEMGCSPDLCNHLLAVEIMKTERLWKITCMEDDNPGLWRRWLKCQCVTVGYGPPGTWEGCKLDGGTRKWPDWNKAKSALKKIVPGDFIVAALPGRRIGRLGRVVEMRVNDDQWEPLIPPSSNDEDGGMGRRILVRWDLEHGPDSLDQVVQLPEDFEIGWRGTLNRIWEKTVKEFQEVMANPANWVGLVGHFGYEWALSDYIALYPHRLEDGMRPHPSKKIHQKVIRVRETRFADRSRSDVLLLDKDEKPVIVECKQNSPSVEDIAQLRHYVRRLKKELGKDARGILVHGGARKLYSKVWSASKESPRVMIFQYKLDVDFAPSC